MMKKTNNIYNVADRRVNGHWVKRFHINCGTHYDYCHTRAGVLWEGIESRCKRHVKYLESGNLFESFDAFVEWSLCSRGYLEKNANGRYWEIDKDILVEGNRDYSVSTCAYVPKYINNLLLSADDVRGDYPLGVHLHRQTGKFRAKCKGLDGKNCHIGLYQTAEDAHNAWQRYKSGVIIAKVDDYSRHPAMSEAVCEALLNRAFKLEQNAANNVATIRL